MSILKQISPMISDTILNWDGQSYHHRVMLALVSDLNYRDKFPYNTYGILSSHFLVACKLQRPELMTAINFIFRTVRAIDHIESKNNIDINHSIINRIDDDLIKACYKSPHKTIGARTEDIDRCYDNLANLNIELIHVMFESLDSELEIDRDVTIIVLNFFALIHRIECSIDMEKDMGIK